MEPTAGPDDPHQQAEACKQKALLSCQQGQLLIAIAHFQQALAFAPFDRESCLQLGNLCFALGDFGQAVRYYQQLLELNPSFAPGHFNLGNALRKLGDLPAAIQHYQQALRHSPAYLEAYNHLGLALQESGQWEAAIACYCQALVVKPGDPTLSHNLGRLYHQQRDWVQADHCYRATLASRPACAATLNNLGLLLHDQGDLPQAVAYYQRAIQAAPAYAEAYTNLGCALCEQGHPGKAIPLHRQALALTPHSPDMHYNLGTALHAQGQVEEALPHYERALQLKPAFTEAHFSRLFNLCAKPGVTDEMLFQHFRDWAQAFDHLSPCYGRRDRDPERRLRIGYISPDLREHSAATAFEALFHYFDAEAVEVFAYADVAQPDARTDWFRSQAHHWRPVHGLSDEGLLALIQQDAIDILIDLAGCTARNRLLVFARQPAPLQVTGLGFGCTTGLQAMGYRFSDRWLSPPESRANRIEELVFLSSLVHWSPPEEPIPLQPPPALANGYATLGCGNSLFKINREVIALWAGILRDMPGSVLHLKAAVLQDAETVQYLAKQFARQGIPRERLVLTGQTEKRAHLAFYQTIDIALDPFPYHGGITTCEALWMGVPVVTLAGGTRAGESLLSLAGFPEGIARTPNEYRARAVALASQPERLADLRPRLRQQLLDSPICDGPGFAREVETIYRQIWRRWCALQS